MEKFMRNAPSLIVFVVMAIQTPRVSAFGERIGVHVALAVIFALFLTLSTFTLAFFQGRTSNYRITADRKNKAEKLAYAKQVKMADFFSEIYWHSTFWLILFVVIEGALNLSETMAELKETVVVMDWEWFGAIAYGIFPTLATLGMGKLQSLVSKMPHGATGASQMDKVFDAFMRWMQNAFDAQADNANVHASHKTQDAPKAKRNADAYPKACPHCGEMQASANAYSGHVGRWCKSKPVAPIGFVAVPVNSAATTTSSEAVEAAKPVKSVK